MKAKFQSFCLTRLGIYVFSICLRQSDCSFPLFILEFFTLENLLFCLTFAMAWSELMGLSLSCWLLIDFAPQLKHARLFQTSKQFAFNIYISKPVNVIAGASDNEWNWICIWKYNVQFTSNNVCNLLKPFIIEKGTQREKRALSTLIGDRG